MVASNQTLNFDVVGGSNQQLIPAYDSQQTVNMFVFIDPVQKNKALYPMPGSKLVVTADVGGNPFHGRQGGAIAIQTEAYFIIGNAVFLMNTAEALTQIGTIGTSTGNVSMCITGQYLVIVDGSSSGWYYDISTTTFTPITDTDAPASPNNVCEQQGFTLFNDTVAFQTSYQAAQYEPFKFDPLNTIQINYQSSIYSYPLIGQYSVNGRIFAITTGFGEVLEDSGKAGYFFRPDTSLTFVYGCPNQALIAKGIGALKGETQPEFLMFICDTNGVRKAMMTHGEPPKVISTPAIEYRLSKVKNLTKCSSFFFADQGNLFWQINFRGENDNFTLVYCISSDSWCDLSYNGGAHFAESLVNFNGKNYVTSYFDSGIYDYNLLYFSNSGAPILRRRITQNIRVSGYRKFTVRLAWLYAQQGSAPVGESITNTKNYVYGARGEISIAMSTDGGQTFEEPQLVSLGKSGEYTYVSKLENFGTTRDCCFLIVCYEPINNFCIMGLMIDVNVMEGTA